MWLPDKRSRVTESAISSRVIIYFDEDTERNTVIQKVKWLVDSAVAIEHLISYVCRLTFYKLNGMVICGVCIKNHIYQVCRNFRKIFFFFLRMCIKENVDFDTYCLFTYSLR